MRPGMLGRGQAMAESLMTVTVNATERTATGKVPAGELRARDVWESRGTSYAKVQPAGRQPQGRTVTIGGAQRTVIDSGLHLPLRAYLTDDGLAIRPGWRFTVIAVGREDDPALLGRTYEVVEVMAKSRATARRLDVAEV